MTYFNNIFTIIEILIAIKMAYSYIYKIPIKNYITYNNVEIEETKEVDKIKKSSITIEINFKQLIQVTYLR